MEDSQNEAKSKSQPKDAYVQGSKSKSSFNYAEYERWSEKLRNRTSSKGK